MEAQSRLPLISQFLLDLRNLGRFQSVGLFRRLEFTFPKNTSHFMHLVPFATLLSGIVLTGLTLRLAEGIRLYFFSGR